jgi:AcrR family transcriptional regulator
MSAPSRVRPTRQQTADRLLNKAAEVFAERGFYGARIEDVCARAGLTRGAFYSSFDSKESLFLALFDRRAVEVLDQLRVGLAWVEQQPTDNYDETIIRLTKGWRHNREWHMLLQEVCIYAVREPAVAARLAERRRSLRDAMRVQVQAFVEKADLEIVVDADMLMRIVNALHNVSFQQHLMEPDALGPRDLYEMFAPSILAGAIRPKQALSRDPKSEGEPQQLLDG